MIIGLTYDIKSDWELKEGDPVDANAEFDKPETVDCIVAALEAGGHQVKRIGNVASLLSQIETLAVDIVFNICEGRTGRNRESQVPTILEMYNIPYIGADGLTLGLTLDKSVAKKLFVADDIPTPRFFIAKDSNNLEELNNIGFPLIVKTCYEGTSKGITDQSRVEDFASLKRQVDFIVNTYNQPAIVEEFIRGTEFTVAVLGNEDAQAMPIVQVSIDGSVDLGDEFYTFERVFSDDLRYICPAEISSDLTKQVQDLAVKTYKAVGCRDFGRVDFRVNDEGTPYVLEINPLPSLEKIDVFNLFPQVIGSTYGQTINQIVDIAAARYGIVGRRHAFAE